jgi:transposase
MEIETSKTHVKTSQLAVANKIKGYLAKYKKFLKNRSPGDKITSGESGIILHVFASLRCELGNVDESDVKIITRCSQICGVGYTTTEKLLENEGIYEDGRHGPIKKSNSIPIKYKKVIEDEIASCLEHGIPCTSRYLKDILDGEGLNFHKATLCRTLKAWEIPYGKLRSADDRKEREHVLENLKNFLEVIKENDERNPDCYCNQALCRCRLRRDVVYLDQSYINQNHSHRFGYYLPKRMKGINKPGGNGPRIVMSAVLTRDGWLGVNQNEITKKLQNPDKNGVHQYGSIVYWASNNDKGDYHGNFNQDIFYTYFKNRVLPYLTCPTIIVLDNASYHHSFDEGTFFPRKAKKDELKNWLVDNEVMFDEKSKKAELITLVESIYELPPNRIEVLAEEDGIRRFGEGHEILYLPQYHPELNPIEMAWSQVKGTAAYGPVYNMKELKESVLPKCFNIVTEDRARKLFRHVIKVENELMVRHEVLKDLVAKSYQEIEWTQLSSEENREDSEEDDFDKDEE